MDRLHIPFDDDDDSAAGTTFTHRNVQYLFTYNPQVSGPTELHEPTIGWGTQDPQIFTTSLAAENLQAMVAPMSVPDHADQAHLALTSSAANGVGNSALHIVLDGYVHVLNDPQLPGNVCLVPQVLYTARRQPQVETQRIDFKSNGRPGVYFDSMILTTGTVVGLENGEERQSFKDFGQKATYRIMWPGYPCFSFPQHVRRTAGPVTRSTIVEHIFKATRNFIENNVRYDTTDQTWKVGPGHIELQDIVLFGVDIVSPGSMQPIYGVRRRR